MPTPTSELLISRTLTEQLGAPDAPLSATERCAQLLTHLLAKEEGVNRVDPATASEIWHKATPTQQIGQARLRRLSSFLIRRYPLYDYHNANFDIAHTHLNVLSGFGLKIVPYTYIKVDNDPSTKGYAVSEYIPNSRKIDLLGEEQRRTDIGTPLHKYLQWVKGSDQDHYLWDIFHPRQFSMQPDSTKPFLHDIDPFLEQANSSATIDFLMKAALPYTRY